MIKLSERFVEDCLLAFQTYYLESQKEAIRLKVNSIFNRLRKFICEFGHLYTDFMELVSNFVVTTGMQFPWTLQQTLLSQAAVKTTFSSV